MASNENNAARINRQIHLPFRRAIVISMRSIKNRMVRSFITVGGIFLAITFLMAILTSSAITDKIQKKQLDQIQTENIVAQTEADKAENATQIWLIVISLIVCGVGITNAMLMSVTERFREIGTMKCLGALNRFIVELFILESAFQGLIGAAAGMSTGIILTVMSFIWKYGWSKVIVSIPVLNLIGQGAMAIVIGTLLAIVAAVYPARIATKMMPADALTREV